MTVPALLIAGNKTLGISSSLRDICAACFPGNVDFLKYDWKKESWNIFFALGILLGGFLGGYVFSNPMPTELSASTVEDLQTLGIHNLSGYLPKEIFNWNNLFSFQGFLLMVVGGFLVGFGTRYAGGCTSGHGIAGLSNLQWPSLVAVICFFIGGIVATYFILPYIIR